MEALHFCLFTITEGCTIKWLQKKTTNQILNPIVCKSHATRRKQKCDGKNPSFRKGEYEQWLTDEEEAARQKDRHLKGISQKPYFSSLSLSPRLPSVKMRIPILPLQNSEIKTVMLVPYFWVTWRNTVSPSITLPLRNAVKMTMLKILQAQIFW